METSIPFFSRVINFLFGRVVPLFFLAGGLLFLVFGTRDIHRGWKSKSWPNVPGVITLSEVKNVSSRGSDGKSHMSYRLRIRYAYQVKEQTYEGDKLGFGTNSHKRRSEALKQQKNFAEGNEVKVVYEPDKPENAVLMPGIGSGTWIIFTLGVVLSGIGLILCILMPRIMKKSSTTGIHIQVNPREFP